MRRDIIGLVKEVISSGKPLLEKVMGNGKITISYPSLENIRARAKENMQYLAPKYKRLRQDIILRN